MSRLASLKFPWTVILDVGENSEIPLILGRPFLVTSGAIIDVPNGELILKVNEDKAVFKVCSKDACSWMPVQHGELKNVCGATKEEELNEKVKAKEMVNEEKEALCDQASCSNWFDPHSDPTKNPWPNDNNQFLKHMEMKNKSKGKSSSFFSCFKSPLTMKMKKASS